MKLKQWLNQTTTNFCKNSCGEDLKFKEVIGYSIAGFGQNLICGLIGSFLMVFMTDALGFGNTTDIFGNALPKNASFWLRASTGVAFLMLGTRIFDAFNDPIMGSIVDRTRTKWGKCRPYLKWTPIPIAIMTILCFLPWYPNNITGFVSLTIIYIVWSVAYTIIDVPYWGLSTGMSKDGDFRNRLLTVSRLLCTAGSGLVTVLIPAISSAITSGFMEENAFGELVVKVGFEAQYQQTLSIFYFICAIVFAVLAVPMFYYGFKTTKERYISDKPAPSLTHNYKLLFKNTPLMMVVLSGILGCARMVYTGAGGMYFATYVLHNYGGSALFSVITILIIPGGLIASVLCPLLQKKFGKKWTYIIVHLVGAVVMFAMFFIGYDAPWKLYVNAVGLVLLGIPQGINNIMSYAMIGDSVDYLELKTGERAEGICFAMQTFINKMGMAATAFIGVMAFSVSGFIENDFSAASVTKTGSDALWQMLILSGAVSMLACTIPMFFYTFTEKKQKEAVEEIARRKKEAGITEETEDSVANDTEVATEVNTEVVTDTTVEAVDTTENAGVAEETEVAEVSETAETETTDAEVTDNAEVAEETAEVTDNAETAETETTDAETAEETTEEKQD